MKRMSCISILVVVLGFSSLSRASLYNNGNGLIYDTDLDITWYDYSYGFVYQPAAEAWAASLSVTDISGVTHTGWRLTNVVDGPFVQGYSGTTTGGWNVTTSEMGHLFYTELGNKGFYDVDGNWNTGYGLKNTGPFRNLMDQSYWSGTEYSQDATKAWNFSFYAGYLYPTKDLYNLAIAVHEGNVGAVPVPVPAAVLLGTLGLATAGWRLRKRDAE